MASNNDDTVSEVVQCNNCKVPLNESPYIQLSERTPCPSCGSMSRYYEKTGLVTVGETIPKAEMKAKHLGKGKPFIEQQGRHELYRKTGEYTDVTRIIDRENNLYKEVIKDSKTGRVIHCCIEFLDKHVGHGSAKNSKVNNDNKM